MKGIFVGRAVFLSCCDGAFVGRGVVLSCSDGALVGGSSTSGASVGLGLRVGRGVGSGVDKSRVGRGRRVGRGVGSGSWDGCMTGLTMSKKGENGAFEGFRSGCVVGMSMGGSVGLRVARLVGLGVGRGPEVGGKGGEVRSVQDGRFIFGGAEGAGVVGCGVLIVDRGGRVKRGPFGFGVLNLWISSDSGTGAVVTAGGAVTDKSEKIGGSVNKGSEYLVGGAEGFSVGTALGLSTGASVFLLNQKLSSWVCIGAALFLDIFLTVTDMTATAVAMRVMVDTNDNRTRYRRRLFDCTRWNK